MNYIKVSIANTENDVSEMLIASLSNIGFDGFEETDTHLNSFVSINNWNEDALNSVAKLYDVSYTTEEIEDENWNAKWESSFEPVIVRDFCAVRADFHKQVSNVQHQVIITPKMSFGTGHHDTTQLMIEYMDGIDFIKKTVLDFGTGTGVLAILAEKLGASSITAIDNDEWSYNNTIENCERNNTHNITTQHTTLDSQYSNKYDIILANINRNILLQYMTEMYAMLNDGGILILSGIMPEDKEILINAITDTGFLDYDFKETNRWVAIKTHK